MAQKRRGAAAAAEQAMQVREDETEAQVEVEQEMEEEDSGPLKVNKLEVSGIMPSTHSVLLENRFVRIACRNVGQATYMIDEINVVGEC
jgi:uncharacterized protein YqfA (UPF0365 family)